MKMSKAASDTLQKVSNEFEGEVLADLQEGRERSLALIEAAKKGAREQVAKILESGVKQAEALKRQISGAAELGARNARLRVLEVAVNDAFEDAVSQISELAENRYEESLARLVAEGVEVIGNRATVTCSPKDKKLVASVVKRFGSDKIELVVGDGAVETIGGVVLTTPDGSVRFDNTFEARLERLRPTLRKEVADLLNG